MLMNVLLILVSMGVDAGMELIASYVVVLKDLVANIVRKKFTLVEASRALMEEPA